MTHISEKPRLAPEFIDYHAMGMVKHLQKYGYTTYLVGGCIRDLMCGQIPKDFDIGTMARPQEVKKLLSFAFIIGKRFRLVLVRREDKQYEVATFRREPKADEFPEGVPFGDNIFGTPEEDAQRRDFTCNALFYDPVKDELIDCVGGKQDIENHLIKMIGDPAIRLQEDPIRILRALRLAHKLDFRIDPDLRRQMQAKAEALPLSVLPRRREEFFKILRLRDPARALHEAFDLGLFTHLAPQLNMAYEEDETVGLFEERLQRMAERLGDPTNTPFLAGSLILAWLRATSHRDPELFFTNDQLYKNEQMGCLMKEFLGLHNWEIAVITKALGQLRTLANPDEFFRRGQRRRQALLHSEVFPLALELAHVDASLSPSILEKWDEQLEMALLQQESESHIGGEHRQPEGARPKGRGRPRRGQRRRRSHQRKKLEP